VTCLIAILDQEKGCLCYSTAGHPPPYFINRDGAKELGGRGVPLGLLPDRSYQDHEVQIEHGDRLLFFSDGLSEAHSPAGLMFSEGPLDEIIRQSAGSDLIPLLLHELAEFTGTRAEPEDDVTLVSLEREEPEATQA